ncbi:MAG: hypothetical protein QF464_22085, partial [Myxococcota bacterium]|nr:hypothetical protein [Myxococcota bacterium]
MTRRALLFCVCIALAACTPKPVSWTSPPVSLPASQHAVALPVKLASMVRPSLSPELWEEMHEDCIEALEAVEPEEEEEEAKLEVKGGRAPIPSPLPRPCRCRRVARAGAP